MAIDPRARPVASDPAEAEALSWLFALSDLERGVGWNPRASPDERWKLGRVRALLDLAGAPDRGLRCVLVAGTKGKGSTVAFLASILHAAGVRAGMYTQPHLGSYRERIRVDGVAIDAVSLRDRARAMREPVAELAGRSPDAGEPTTFEVTTAIALDHFVRSGCSVALLEVGLGGRLDATNAVDPELSVVTSISRDHTEILGPTLGAIAREKAGIMRCGRVTLVAEQRPAARAALGRACRAVGARCRTVAPLVSRALPLPGDHQRQNAALAIAAARELGVDAEAIRLGVDRARWPGRFEVVPGPPELVLDGAHNDASADALARTLRQHARGRPLVLVLGVHADKDARAIARPLVPLARCVVVTSSASPRARPPEDLARVLRRVAPALDVRVSPTVPDALAAARSRVPPHGLVCVTGSLAVVGEARGALRLPPIERLW